jgi:hypothetical protein
VTSHPRAQELLEEGALNPLVRLDGAVLSFTSAYRRRISVTEGGARSTPAAVKPSVQRKSLE